MTALDPGILEEIRAGVSEAVGRFGVAGLVRIAADQVYLEGHGPTVSAPLGAWVSQWDSLSPEVRSRRCTEIARVLARQRRASVAESTPRRAFTLPVWLAPLAILLTGAGVLVAAWRYYPVLVGSFRPEKDPAASAQEAMDADERERNERAARVCDATRSRVLRGASVGPADVEGWVVEIALLSRETKPLPSRHPALETFFAASGPSRRLIWPSTPALVEKSGPNTAVTIHDASLPTVRAPQWGGVRIVFSGRYVTPFFEERERADYIRLASALAAALSADHAALYARCAHNESHHIGTWFRGQSPGGATASLLYFMGTYADVPHLGSTELDPSGAGVIDRIFCLERLTETTASLDKARVSTLLAPSGGMIAGDDKHPSTITFALRDANRADRASRGIARELGVGVDR